MNKKQLLQYLQNDVYIRVGKSKVHGVGLIAIRDIPKGINPLKLLYEPKWHRFTHSELKDLPDPVRKLIYDYFAEEENRVDIPDTGFNPFELLLLINHSPTPNVITKDGGITFVTARVIKKGEEILADYATYDDDYQKKFDS